MGSVKLAVIPCAGLGTRFLPATKAQPKEMLPVFDKPAIQYIVEEAINANINNIVVVTGRGKQSIENHFDESFELEYRLREKNKTRMLTEVQRISNLVNLFYVRQKSPLGLGHAIYSAESVLRHEPFAVFLADDIIYSEKPAISQLVEAYDKYKTVILAVEEVSEDRVSSYGIIKGKEIENNTYKVEDLIEKPEPSKAPSNLAVVGRYILVPEILGILEKLPKGKNGEIQLTDALKIYNKKNPVYAVKIKGKRYDTGDKLGYMQASIEYALKDKEIGSKLKDIIKKI